MSPQWCYFAVKIICALLKQDGVALVGNIRKEIHIPTRNTDHMYSLKFCVCCHFLFLFAVIVVVAVHLFPITVPFFGREGGTGG